MNKIIASLLCLGFTFCTAEVKAQSFVAGTISDKAAPAPAVNDTVKQNVADSDEQKQPEVKEKDLLVNSVEKKLDGEENREDEKKYDNTYGKIAHMRIVNGEVVFDDERYILVSYDNYKVEKGLDGITRCSMRIYVLNDLRDRINSLGLKLKWPKISTNVQMNKVNPGVKTYMDVMLLGDGCLSMDKAPTIEVNRCRVKGMNEDKCSDAIRWFKKNQ